MFSLFQILISIGLSVGFAKDKPKKRAPASEFKYTLSAQEWMGLMSRDLPKAFCDNKEYYSFCFDADNKTCNSLVQKITSKCYKRMNIPKTVRLSTQGIDLGQTLGRCVGTEYEKSMTNKRKNLPVCKESRQWF